MKNMNIKYRLLIPILFFAFSNGLQAQSSQELNNILNELKVELVQPGTVSTNDFEFGTSISPDENELFFVKGISGFRRTVLVYCHWKDGYWSEPKIAPFSGKHRDMNPYHSKDGKRLYYTSDRPTPNPLLKKSNLWYVDKTVNGWSEPKLVEGMINDEFEIVYPTVHSDGTIHFVSWSRPGTKKGDIFVSKLENGTYTAPERIDELNTVNNDADPEMSQDGKFMFITSMRDGGFGHYDLYVFKKQKDGKWGKGINLGTKVNSINMDSDPILSPDGQTLYFSSNRLDQLETNSERFTDYQMLVKSFGKIHNGLMNIYKVDISHLLVYLNNF
ncbi:PD40 domain-containing protein [Aquimarina aquimarini]|uniref:PD40 domain-containing protein n=1 Tax=Aquimarina aquimarini TaxID=1191734 RepID=UPI00131EF686|nr:PD40 domain-containing protein [Aquimarina aquimarini]